MESLPVISQLLAAGEEFYKKREVHLMDGKHWWPWQMLREEPHTKGKSQYNVFYILIPTVWEKLYMYSGFHHFTKNILRFLAMFLANNFDNNWQLPCKWRLVPETWAAIICGSLLDGDRSHGCKQCHPAISPCVEGEENRSPSHLYTVKEGEAY